MQPLALLTRLAEIGQSLAHSGHALALIGLGSAGAERDRMDEFSDLDFFAIVETGHKRRYLENLDWLSNIAPIAYHFLNTDDGYKLLFADGIFCEFAVFEPDELKKIPSVAEQVVWMRSDAPDLTQRSAQAPSRSSARTQEFLVGEAVTNLYVGLGRDKRGEKLSAARFIQGYAVDRLVELADHLEPGENVSRDPFAGERRFEQRHPAMAREMSAWLQGYDRNRESALAILSFLERHFEVNQAIATAIRELCN
jgi:hypothetical protein